jgi:hypothetical protein
MKNKETKKILARVLAGFLALLMIAGTVFGVISML